MLVLLAALVLLLVVPPARAEQVVIVREMHTPPEMPFGGKTRIIERSEGRKLREDQTTTTNTPPPDSLESGEARRIPEPDEMTAIWFPGEGTWRMWGPKPKDFEEITPAELAASLKDDSMGGLEEFFGTRESLVSEIEFAVDSSGAAQTIAGLLARPYVARGLIRFHELESDFGDSIRFAREVWIVPEIPGVSGALPKPQERPSAIMGKVITAMQSLMLPILKEASHRLDEQVARMPGQILRDEFRLEPTGRTPAGAQSLALYHTEVLEIRREPSRPDAFRVPPGLHKRVPAAPTIKESAPRRR